MYQPLMTSCKKPFARRRSQWTRVISLARMKSEGGRLWGSATGGRGATFYFTLPCLTKRSDTPAIHS
jgi:hypothetical protein